MSLAFDPRPRKTRPDRAPDDGWREFITPEGVDLRLRIGSYMERCAAFALDLAIMAVVLVGFSLVALVTLWSSPGDTGIQIIEIIWLLGFFLLRNFYLVIFEMRPGGATPGKRALGLRVVTRDGGRLTADAVFARNAMREIEFFLPAIFFLARGQGIDAALIGLGAIWSGVFLFFPLFNRDRLRLGDLAAGTMVVRTPKRVLAPDLSESSRASHRRASFTDAQLDAYGIKELQVLEQVLRSGERQAITEVARRIRRKIDWQGGLELSDRSFLSDYYTELRARLESRLLFGHRRADKFDRP